MVEEVRKILLNQNEFLAALEAYRRACPNFLPAGRILRWQKESDVAIKVFVEVAYGKTVQTMEIALDEKELVEPIIKFCIENNVMLPRAAKKMTRFEGDKVALHVLVFGNPMSTI